VVPLDILPLWAFFLVAVAGCLLCTEGGFRLATKVGGAPPAGDNAPVGSLVASTLALLAFMLAFTFGVATSRFETRRLLVVDESNAIGTAYLRADFLEEPSRTNVKNLLRQYAALRIHGVQGIAENESKYALVRFEELIAKSNHLQQSIWAETAAAGQKHPNWPVYSIFINSINDMIDMQEKRVAAARDARVPGSVWGALFLIAALSMAGTGYYHGMSGKRNLPELIFMVLAFSAALFIVVDLDRPFEGTIMASQQPMIDVAKSIGAI
jgi:hypothetical protein